MSAHYKKFLQLLEKWPVDKTKQGRDLGQHLRDQLKGLLGSSNIISVKDQKFEKQFQSLENLATDKYFKVISPIISINIYISFFLYIFFSIVEISQTFIVHFYRLDWTTMRSSIVVRLPRILERGQKDLIMKFPSLPKLFIRNNHVLSHQPVMLNETLEFLKPHGNQTFIDMTFGAGGHTRKILEIAPNAKVICLDRDPTAHKMAKKMTEEFPNRLTPLLGKFSELSELLHKHQIKQNSIDGVLFDFGCSSMQFDEAERGFSLKNNGPLDMRMDKDRDLEQPSAADILARIDENDLARIFKVYGEEKQAKKIARAIVDARYAVKKLETTKELADLVYAVFGSENRMDKLQRPAHVATKVFQV